ncbi:hypothetical protein BD408DRAFT_438422 [Parasitella parasitica]|nr:hypothetical protein BD408DRAFT_438422 [Parasitella parasitica]
MTTNNTTIPTKTLLTPLKIATDLLVEYYKSYRSNGIYKQEQIHAWKNVISTVHQKGALIYVQLWHIDRAGASNLTPNNEQPVGPSNITVTGSKIYGDAHEEPHVLEIGNYWTVPAIGEERTAIRLSLDGEYQDVYDDTVTETWS